MSKESRKSLTALPTDPTQLPAGPDRVDIEALHLSINQTWDSGSSHNIHLLENGDLNVILHRGQPERPQIPHDADGTIVIALNVDDDHDEVHYSSVSFVGGAEEVISQALEALVACRSALARVSKA